MSAIWLSWPECCACSSLVALTMQERISWISWSAMRISWSERCECSRRPIGTRPINGLHNTRTGSGGWVMKKLGWKSSCRFLPVGFLWWWRSSFVKKSRKASAVLSLVHDTWTIQKQQEFCFRKLRHSENISEIASYWLYVNCLMDRGNFLLEERKFPGKIVFFWNPAVDRYLSLVRACDCSHHIQKIQRIKRYTTLHLQAKLNKK